MTNFVLVHCGFAGAWIWRDVAERLCRAGHSVFTPTLTGLAERAHLAQPDVDLETHVQDLLAVIACAGLDHFVLVASSSGSMAATGLAHRIPEKISQLVYLDTLIPGDGQSWLDLLTPAIAEPMLALARQYGEGWRIPHPTEKPPRWVPQPVKTVAQPLQGNNPAVANIPHVYVHSLDRPVGWFLGLGDVIDREAARVQAYGWRYLQMAADHLPMLSAPAELAALLDGIARE